ncbi:hypothetical protein KY308_01045 [Candidatus Woesearchaeota archaeon]|nr:hypothetical protein [Candidatus Woesearchaeota archaeon]
MGLEGSADCGGSCSWLDSFGTPVSHQEVERKFDRVISQPLDDSVKELIKSYIGVEKIKMKYRLAKAHIEDNFPKINKILKYVGFKTAYKSPYQK